MLSRGFSLRNKAYKKVETGQIIDSSSLAHQQVFNMRDTTMGAVNVFHYCEFDLSFKANLPGKFPSPPCAKRSRLSPGAISSFWRSIPCCISSIIQKTKKSFDRIFFSWIETSDFDFGQIGKGLRPNSRFLSGWSVPIPGEKEEKERARNLSQGLVVTVWCAASPRRRVVAVRRR